MRLPRLKLHVSIERAGRTFAHHAADRHHAVADVIVAQPDVGFQHGSARDGAEALLDKHDTALLCGASRATADRHSVAAPRLG